jgi:hypothetical protein
LKVEELRRETREENPWLSWDKVETNIKYQISNNDDDNSNDWIIKIKESEENSEAPSDFELGSN